MPDKLIAVVSDPAMISRFASARRSGLVSHAACLFDRHNQ